MKRWKRFLHIFLSVCLFLAMTMPASAKEEEYTYTIRFFAGQQGSFATGEVVVFTGLHYGARINFYQNAVTLNDNSKYYVRGIRESGKDNSDSTQANSFLVTGDMDYVVAYGILGDATSYTINYVDGAGNALAPSETYYGNVGDRPVVAYIYIEGWTPEAYNMTQTLQKDPAENIFTFVYTRNEVEAPPQPPAPAPEPEAPTPEPPAPAPAPAPTVPTVPGFEVIEDPELPTAAGPGGEGGGNQGAQQPVQNGTNQGAGQNIPDSQTPTGNAPDEVRDLDEDDVPAGNFLKVAADARLLGIPVPVVIVVALGAVGAAWYFLFLKKKNKKEEKS